MGTLTGWFQDIFLPHVFTNNPSGKPILLITDSHKSHETREVLVLAHQHQIILFSLPPHTTHKLQPLDVAIFGPLQNAWGHRCQESAIQGMHVSRAIFVEEYLAVVRFA